MSHVLRDIPTYKRLGMDPSLEAHNLAEPWVYLRVIHTCPPKYLSIETPRRPFPRLASLGMLRQNSISKLPAGRLLV